MAAERWVQLQLLKKAGDMIGGVAEERRCRCMDRNVEMDAPFGAARFLPIVGGRERFAVQRVLQVAVAFDVAALVPLNHLMEIDVIGEGSQRLARFGRGPDPKRRTDVNLADLDLV